MRMMLYPMTLPFYFDLTHSLTRGLEKRLFVCFQDAWKDINPPSTEDFYPRLWNRVLGSQGLGFKIQQPIKTALL